MQREGGISQNAFPSNLDTVNLKIFPNNGGVFTWRYEDNALTIL